MGKNIKSNLTKREKTIIDDLTLLPFVKDIGKGKKTKRTFWHTESTGDYMKDWALGERYGMLALEYMMKNGETNILGWSVLAMQETNIEEAKGIKLGFLSFMARAAMQTLANPFELYGKLQSQHNNTEYIMRNS